MLSSLLSTKLFIPQPRADMIRRSRLFEKISLGMNRAFILISAPAGFGKTTLLSTWIDQNAIPTAWLSLDQSDNDPARFLAYLLTALQSVIPNCGAEILEALDSPQPDYRENTLISIINEISATSPGDFVLVLDDYHLITASAVNAITHFLLDRMPPGMHLVIATRADPDLPLPRMRGRGEVIEIRQDDLRFTRAEVTAFINQMQGLKLTPEDIGLLNARTEGWIAGLQMAAISMAVKSDTSQFIKEFTGSDRYILDYLMDEVFQVQPVNIQDFLLQTSPLNRLTASLCNALTGGKNGQETLEYLERENLFILPLDNERNWYRYHHLFSDLLQKRLAVLDSDQIPALHMRASSWFAANGFFTDGIEHALAAQEYDTAVELITQVAEDILMRSELTKILKWLEAIPDEIIRQNLVLSIYYAYVLLLYGKPIEIIESYCGTLKTATDKNKGYISALRSLIAIIQQNIPEAVRLSQLALQTLPENDRFLRGMASWVQGAAVLVSGDFESSFQTLEDFARQSRAAGNMMGFVLAAVNQASVHIFRGELIKAKRIYEQVLAFAKNREGTQLPIAGAALFGLGELHYEWNQLGKALEYIETGLELSDKWGTLPSVDGLIAKAKIFQARGDLETAHEILLDAYELVGRSDTTVVNAYQVASQLAELSLAQGNVTAAIDWARDRKLGKVGVDGKLNIADSLAELDQALAGKSINTVDRQSTDFYTLIDVLIAKAQYTEALEILDRLLEYAQQRNLSGRKILLKTLTAVVQHKLGDLHSALDALKTALQLAEPEGYCRMFLDRGQPMRELLMQTGKNDIAPRYASDILAVFDRDLLELSSIEGLLVDPLSEREMDVLRYLPTKLTALEIADQLYVAESTVRTHIKHIYSKLSVNRRIEAVERAKELGLL